MSSTEVYGPASIQNPTIIAKSTTKFPISVLNLANLTRMSTTTWQVSRRISTFTCSGYGTVEKLGFVRMSPTTPELRATEMIWELGIFKWKSIINKIPFSNIQNIKFYSKIYFSGISR